jgi:hypothetical protein
VCLVQLTPRGFVARLGTANEVVVGPGHGALPEFVRCVRRLSVLERPADNRPNGQVMPTDAM